MSDSLENMHEDDIDDSRPVYTLREQNALIDRFLSLNHPRHLAVVNRGPFQIRRVDGGLELWYERPVVGRVTDERVESDSNDREYPDATEEQVMDTDSESDYELPLYSRLLGPGSQNLTMSGPVIAEPSLRVSNRVVVMENGFGILPPAEDNLEFDQSGYLFGPNLAAISHVPSALYWWNEESKLLDGDSEADACIIQAHKLMPFLEMHREAELAERKRKRQEEEGFDYKNSVLKNSNETMEIENKPAEAQTSARSDSSGNESASDTAQLLAESIIDSVLRPTTSTSTDNRGKKYQLGHKFNKIYNMYSSFRCQWASKTSNSWRYVVTTTIRK